MAEALDPKRPKVTIEGHDELETISEAALSFVKEALNREEKGSEESALLHYEESLRLLDRALAIDLSQDHSLSEEALKKGQIDQTKMSRTRQQVIFRIHELRTKLNAQSLDPPPAYEESLSDINHESDSNPVPLPPSDADILFTIAGKVQIFYISSNGKVSAPSYPSSLFIFKFKSGQNLQNDVKLAPAFLQVGTWVYPLVVGKSPVLKSNEGSYMFPDLDSEEAQIGNAIGLILPPDILDLEKQQFEEILTRLTTDPRADLKEYDECLEYSAQVSDSLIKGAEAMGRGMVKGAIKSSEWMYIGAEKLKDRIVPESTARQVDPRLKTGLGKTKLSLIKSHVRSRRASRGWACV